MMNLKDITCLKNKIELHFKSIDLLMIDREKEIEGSDNRRMINDEIEMNKVFLKFLIQQYDIRKKEILSELKEPIDNDKKTSSINKSASPAPHITSPTKDNNNNESSSNDYPVNEGNQKYEMVDFSFCNPTPFEPNENIDNKDNANHSNKEEEEDQIMETQFSSSLQETTLEATEPFMNNSSGPFDHIELLTKSQQEQRKNDIIQSNLIKYKEQKYINIKFTGIPACSYSITFIRQKTLYLECTIRKCPGKASLNLFTEKIKISSACRPDYHPSYKGKAKRTRLIPISNPIEKDDDNDNDNDIDIEEEYSNYTNKEAIEAKQIPMSNMSIEHTFETWLHHNKKMSRKEWNDHMDKRQRITNYHPSQKRILQANTEKYKSQKAFSILYEGIHVCDFMCRDFNDYRCYLQCTLNVCRGSASLDLLTEEVIFRFPCNKRLHFQYVCHNRNNLIDDAYYEKLKTLLEGEIDDNDTPPYDNSIRKKDNKTNEEKDERDCNGNIAEIRNSVIQDSEEVKMFLNKKRKYSI